MLRVMCLGNSRPNETDFRVGVVKQLGEGFNLGTRLGYLSTNLGSSFNIALRSLSRALLVDFSLDYLIKSTSTFDLTTYWSLTNVGKKVFFLRRQSELPACSNGLRDCSWTTR